MAVAFFGDGAMNQGYFFECLNFCKVQSLPIVLVCENNGYGEYTPFEDVTAGAIRARAEVMEVPAETIDGMEVVDGARGGRARGRGTRARGGGPQFVEAITYRYVGHSRSDPASTGPPGELDRWRERDPLVLLRARLEARRRRGGAARRARGVGRGAAGRDGAARPRGAVPRAAARSRSSR